MVWIILCMNILTVAIAFRKRMILYAVLNSIFIFLITGQAFQIQSDLEKRYSVDYLFNFISDAGFERALWYVLGISLIALLLATFSRGYCRGSFLGTDFSFAPGRLFYISLFSLLCLLSGVLIFTVVGWSEFLHSSRPGFQTGSTIFIVLLYLGVVPLLLKIFCRSKIGMGDIACFLVSFGVTAGFSRIHLILYLFILLMALYYSRGWADETITPGMVIKIIAFGAIATAAFFVIGALHDAQNFVSGSFTDLAQFILSHPEKSILSIEYNYRVGIEGMSGIAGVFSQTVAQPHSVRMDYGASWLLQGSIQWLPGVLKDRVSQISDLSDALNWYSSSIVPTGAESFFESFGWAAVLLYPLTVYLLAWQIPLWILHSKVTPLLKVIAYTSFACSIFFVRGNLPTWMAFSLSYVVLVVLAWPLFSHYVVRLQGERMKRNKAAIEV